MNTLASEISTEDLTPHMDIIFFKNEDGIYAEYGVDLTTKPKYRPLSFRAIEGLLKDLQNQKAMQGAFASFDNNFVPKNVIYHSVRGLYPSIAWIVKGKYRPYYTRHKDDIMLFYPHILFFIDREKLYMFALKTLNVKPDTMLYTLPFPNMYEGGSMCWGSVRRNKLFSKSLNRTMENCEAAFFNSNFTGELMGNNKVFKKKYFNKNVPFPKSILKPYKRLKDVMY